MQRTFTHNYKRSFEGEIIPLHPSPTINSINLSSHKDTYLLHPSTYKGSSIVERLFLTLTFRSPDMLAPAKIPVAAGKKTAKTEKNPSLS